MKPILMAVFISGAFSSTFTYANSYSSTSLSNYKYTLEDLDLNDGITPSISFNLNSAYGGYSIGIANAGIITDKTGSNVTTISETVKR